MTRTVLASLLGLFLATALIVTTASASAVTEDPRGEVARAVTIQVGSSTLTDHECNSGEWHFVITQLNEGQAPAAISVTWSNGSTSTVMLDKVTGKTAHYTTTGHLDLTVRNATA